MVEMGGGGLERDGGEVGVMLCFSAIWQIWAVKDKGSRLEL